MLRVTWRRKEQELLECEGRGKAKVILVMLPLPRERESLFRGILHCWFSMPDLFFFKIEGTPVASASAADDHDDEEQEENRRAFNCSKKGQLKLNLKRSGPKNDPLNATPQKTRKRGKKVFGHLIATGCIRKEPEPESNYLDLLSVIT